MKFKYFAFTVFITIASAVSAFAQAQAPIKIALIDTIVFYDEKAGITKLIAATKALDAEFAVRIKAMKDGNARLQTIANDLKALQAQPKANAAAISNKQDEGQRLQRELEYKKTELETAIAKRRSVVIEPISQDIGKGIDEFAKKNGYGLILDVGKLFDSGALLFLANNADATKDFITFYNTKPATPVKP